LIALSILGCGHFGFKMALVCKKIKTTYLTNVSDEKITTGTSVTSSTRARDYLEYRGTRKQHAVLLSKI